MSKIIDKLGITPDWRIKKPNSSELVIIPKKAALGNGSAYCIVGGMKDADERIKYLSLIAAAPEMLDALIYSAYEMTQWCGGLHEEIYFKIIDVIQKATGKTWEKIKELYSED